MAPTTGSDICGDLIGSLRGDVKGRLRVEDLLATLKESAFSVIILLFTMPNGVPGPSIPGLSTLTGLPVLIFAIEAAAGRQIPRLPNFAGRMRLNRYKVIRHLERIRPYLLNIENMMKPRLGWLVAHQRTNFALCALYGVVLTVPIPMGNLVSAWAIIVLSLGMVIRDGIFVIVGHLIGFIAIAWNIAIVIAGIKIIRYGIDAAAT